MNWLIGGKLFSENLPFGFEDFRLPEAFPFAPRRRTPRDRAGILARRNHL